MLAQLSALVVTQTPERRRMEAVEFRDGGRFDDRGADAGMTEHPGELDLRHSDAALLRHMGEAVPDAAGRCGGPAAAPSSVGPEGEFADQCAGGERGLGEKAEVLLGAEIRILELETSRLQQRERGAGDLEGRQTVLVREGVAGCDPPGREARDAHVGNPAATNERPERRGEAFERAQRLVPFDEQKVEPIGVQPAERALAVGEQVLAEVRIDGEACIEQDATGEHDLVAGHGAHLQPPPDVFLGRECDERGGDGIATPDRSGLDEIAPVCVVAVEDGRRFVHARAPPKVGGAERERGDEEFGATEDAIFHDAEEVTPPGGVGGRGTGRPRGAVPQEGQARAVL